jgi:hypothetical protein
VRLMKCLVHTGPGYLSHLRRRARNVLHGVDGRTQSEMLLALNEAATFALIDTPNDIEPINVIIRIDDSVVEAIVSVPASVQMRAPVSTSTDLQSRRLWMARQLVDELRIEADAGERRLVLRRRLAKHSRTLTAAADLAGDQPGTAAL